MPSPIITLQLGGFSNYVGAHFWNLQDEAIASGSLDIWRDIVPCVDQEVVCAWSEDARGWSTYCPRTVAVDFSGALGGVSFLPAVTAGDTAGDAACNSWQGGVEVVHTAGARGKSRFRQAIEDAAVQPPVDDDAAEEQQAALEAAALALQEQHARHWTDFLQVDLHPSTALVIPGVWQGSGAWQDWGPAPEGSGVIDALAAAADRVRWWAEQCDTLQGLQVLADDTGGWGSTALQLVQELRDDFPLQPLWYYSLQEEQEPPGVQQQQQQSAAATSTTRQSLARTLSVAELTQLVTLYVPLAPPPLPIPRVQSMAAHRYHSSAVLAAALDTITLPMRSTGAATALGTAQGCLDMHSLSHMLTQPAANLAAASLQLPVPSLPAPGGDSGRGLGPSWWDEAGCSGSGSAAAAGCFQLTPGLQQLDAALPVLAESVVLRGAQCCGRLSNTSVAHQVLDAALMQHRQRAGAADWPLCSPHSCVVPLPLPLPLSLPRWLGACDAVSRAPLPAAASSGMLSVPCAPRPGLLGVQPTPGALSRLAAHAGFEPWLRRASASLRREAHTMAGQSCLSEWGYAAADAVEQQERLLELAARYSHEDG